MDAWDPTSLTWNLHKIFLEVHIWGEDSEINGIPDKVAMLHTSDFVKQKAANYKLINSPFGHCETKITWSV
jgi:hypothetical protein